MHCMRVVNRIEAGVDERGEGVWSSCSRAGTAGGKRRRGSKRGIQRKNESKRAVRLQQRCPSINGVPSGNSAERLPVEPLAWLEFLQLVSRSQGLSGKTNQGGEEQGHLKREKKRKKYRRESVMEAHKMERGRGD